MSERTDVLDKKNKIIECLLKKPMTTSELGKCTKFHRDTIYNLCRTLINEGKLKPKNGKFGKYAVNFNYYRHPTYKGNKFCSTFFDRFNPVSILGEFMCTNFFRKDFQDYIKMQMSLSDSMKNELLDEEIIYENQLYSFIVAIGAYITFALIYGMSPNLWNFKRDEINRIDKSIPSDAKILGKDKENATKEWIKNCIDPIKIMKAFSRLEMVKNNIPIYDPMFKPAKMEQLLPKPEKWKNLTTEEKKRKKDIAKWIAQKMENKYKEIQKRDSKKNPYLSSYEYVSSDEYEKLIKAFERLFPFYFKKFQKILQEIENDLV